PTTGQNAPTKAVLADTRKQIGLTAIRLTQATLPPRHTDPGATTHPRPQDEMLNTGGPLADAVGEREPRVAYGDLGGVCPHRGEFGRDVRPGVDLRGDRAVRAAVRQIVD